MKKIIVGSALFLTATASQAAIDLTSVTTGFGDLNTAITTIGGLLLASAVLAVAFKWAKGMIFS